MGRLMLRVLGRPTRASIRSLNRASLRPLATSSAKREVVAYDDVQSAVSEVKAAAKAKFDETVELVVQLNVDPRKADELVRGVAILPNGTGNVVRVAVFAKDEKAAEAREAGASIVGADDLVKAIQNGELNFDTCIATPDMMSLVGRVARILGPRGMMPNPKLGTVTTNVAGVVKEIQSGRVQFRVDKTGNVHAGVGKISFPEEHLVENVQALAKEIMKQKPAAIKNKYVKGAAMSSTMGPGMRLTPAAIEAAGALA